MSEFTEICCDDCGQGWTPTYFGDEDGVATHDCEPDVWLAWQMAAQVQHNDEERFDARRVFANAKESHKDRTAIIHTRNLRKRAAINAEYRQMLEAENG